MSGASRLRHASIAHCAGDYSVPCVKKLKKAWFVSWAEEAELIQKTFNINADSMDQLRRILFPDVDTARASEAFIVSNGTESGPQICAE